MAGTPTPSPQHAVSFKNDIVPLFRPMDIQCMRAKNVFLIDYGYMSQSGNASMVLGYLKGTSTPRMPFGGPYWSPEAIQLFQDWIDGGYQA
jgi:hypothetical protein